MTKFDSDYFEEKFPNLYGEIEGEDTEKVKIDAVRTNSDEGEKAASSNCDEGPGVVDFLQLCDDDEEALEIIDHMEDEGKIEQGYAKDLRKQLEEEGVRSFGAKRKPGNYSFTD